MKNQKGFSLVEMLAVLMISTVVLVPMMFSLTNNLEINHRLITRNAASLLTESTVIGFDMMSYRDLNDSLEHIDNTNNYIEYSINAVDYDNQNLCEYDATLTNVHPDDIENKHLCGFIFNSRANNLTFNSDEFKVFVYPYYLDEIEFDILINDENLPIRVRNSIAALGKEAFELKEDDVELRLLRITVWIKYGPNNQDVVVRNGVISRD